jgi:hypothetical protein
MAKNARLNWVHPTTRESGEPLDPADIESVETFMSANMGGDFVSLGTHAPDKLEQVVADLGIGTYLFRAIWTDTKDKSSVPAEAQGVVPDETPPAVGELTVTIE